MFRKFSFATFARLVQAAFPLLLYPYLINAVGVAKLGEVLYWVSLSAFLANLAGLNIESYSAKKIKEATSQDELYTAILTPVVLKAIVSIAFLVAWLVIIYFNNSGVHTLVLMIFSVYPFLTVVLIPSHVVLGMGRFKELFIATVIEKIFLLLLVLLFIKSEKDYYLIPLLYFSSLAISAFYYWFIAFKPLIHNFNSVKLIDINFKEYLKVTPVLFFGKLTQLHTNAGKFLLGTFVGVQYIVVYDVCEKIINVFKMPLSIVGQVAFSSIDRSSRSYAKLFMYLFFIALILVFIIFIFGHYLTRYFLGEENVDLAIATLKTLSLIILFMPLLLAFGINYLVKFGKPTAYGKVLLFCNLTSIIILLSIYIFGDINFQKFLYWVVFCEVSLSIVCALTTFQLMRKKCPK